jgi:hypothetical protein
MTAAGLVARLQAGGVRLRRAGDDIAVGPRNRLTAADRQALTPPRRRPSSTCSICSHS